MNASQGNGAISGLPQLPHIWFRLLLPLLPSCAWDMEELSYIMFVIPCHPRQGGALSSRNSSFEIVSCVLPSASCSSALQCEVAVACHALAQTLTLWGVIIDWGPDFHKGCLSRRCFFVSCFHPFLGCLTISVATIIPDVTWPATWSLALSGTKYRIGRESDKNLSHNGSSQFSFLLLCIKTSKQYEA